DGVSVVIVGSAADVPTGREIEAHLARSNGHARTLNLVGATDLPALAGVLVMCRALVTNDSGAMHLAAALGVRVTAVFGPTDERATAPLGTTVRLKPDTTYEDEVGDSRSVRLQPDRSWITVLTHPVWCRPCMLRE